MATLLKRRSRWLLAGLVAAVIVLLFILPGQLVEFLWLDALGFRDAYWTLRLVQLGLFAAGFAVVAGYLAVNFRILLHRLPPLELTRWTAPGGGQQEAAAVGELRLTRERLRRIGYGLSVALGFLFAMSCAGAWNEAIRYSGDQAYGLADPLFGRDMAFYLLRLPFLEVVQNLLVGVAFLGLLLMVVVYLLIGDIVVQGGRPAARPKVVWHLSLCAAVLLAMWGWGFFLDRYGLLFSEGGVVYGAGYTDVHVRLPALWVMIGLSALLVVLLVANVWLKRPMLLVAGAGVYVLAGFIGLTVVPGVVQQFSVEPNELTLEEPFLAYNIALTREAYGMGDVRQIDYPALQDLTEADLQEAEQTVRNVRVWDPRLLVQTYRQIQEIRTYYEFYSVDVDRYLLDGEYQQVMLSARELSQDLPGSGGGTWFNRHLQYTHGYGIAMSPAAQRGREGVPDLYVRDLPPVVDVEGLEIEQPAIYYGEFTPTYRIVDTEAEELAYPQGAENVYTSYAGPGGVELSSWWRRLLFAWTEGDANIILSDYITPESQIQFRNRIQERIRHVAPFLMLDRDPYLVVADGQLVWVQDAYTLAARFPYAEPTQGRFAYIRNSVKATVNAYTGEVDFFVVDEDDPVIASYMQAFPELFRPLEAMSEDLQAHLRYPQDLFEVQVERYTRYHMDSPQVFYNNEDLWERPTEQYAGQTQVMEPYYILTELPDEEQQQFLLMSPFTPSDRDNMIAWMAARSDQPGYGELLVYRLPKDRLVYGPAQIEAQIDQDPEISRQLSLWDQRGSSVNRGNLIVMPVGRSFIYVEPVYLIAEGTQIPQLRRVIVAYGDRVAMQPTLEEALNQLFGTTFAVGEGGGLPFSDRTAGTTQTFGQVPLPDRVPDQLQGARDALERADEALRQGDLEAFGRAFEELRDELEAEAAQLPAPTPTDTIP